MHSYSSIVASTGENYHGETGPQSWFCGIHSKVVGHLLRGAYHGHGGGSNLSMVSREDRLVVIWRVLPFNC